MSYFEQKKKEEFTRRVISNLKNLVEQNKELSFDEIEDLIFLI
jgi:hypothetical protein